jgi:hypothetical protein
MRKGRAIPVTPARDRSYASGAVLVGDNSRRSHARAWGARNGATYGERGGSVETTITYGGVTLRLSFDAQNSTATLQGVTRSLPAGTNIVLVDGAESPHGPRIVGTVAVPVAGPIDPRTRTLAPFLKRSPEMMAFLQCDAATSDRDRALRGIVSDDQGRP